jgi:hypothetical protein
MLSDFGKLVLKEPYSCSYILATVSDFITFLKALEVRQVIGPEAF